MSKFDKSLKECRVIIDGCSGHVYGDIHLIKETLNYGKELENENMMLKTKLAMYEELVKVKDKYIDVSRYHTLCVMNNEDEKIIFEAHTNMIDCVLKEQELEEQIKSLDKKCDGACEI